MANMLQRLLVRVAGRQPQMDAIDDLLARERPHRGGYNPLVPASARTPEAQRYAAVFTDEATSDENDEDLRFLASLAAEVDSAPPAKKADAPAPGVKPTSRQSRRPLSMNQKMVEQAPADELRLFRELAPVRERAITSASLRVQDVEIDELLDDLAVTMSALRRRRAA